MKMSELSEWGRIVKDINTTVDVGPNEIKTQAAKFGNIVDKDGFPPTMSTSVKSTRIVKEIEEPRYTAREWAIIEGGHTLDELVVEPKKLGRLFTALTEGIMLKLERDKRANMLVLHVKDTETGRRSEVRGKLGYETNGYDANDPLHQLLDKIGKTANISELMNGELVSISPKHPQGADAIATAKKITSEAARSFSPQVSPLQDLVKEYLFFTSMGQLGTADGAKSTASKNEINSVLRTLSQSHKNLNTLDKSTLDRNREKILSHIHEMMKYAIAHFREHLTPENFDSKKKQINSVLTRYNTVTNNESVEENFADGKKPGRKGLAKRSGVNTKASVSSLRKTAKSSSGEKQRMAHWLANMKSGKKKSSESIVEFDEDEEIYYSKKLAPVAKKLFREMYPDAKVLAREEDDGYLVIKTTDGEFGFSIGVSHQYGDNIISVANAYAGGYKGIVGKLVQAAVALLKKNHPDAETVLNVQHDVSDNYWPTLANKLGITYDNTAW